MQTKGNKMRDLGAIIAKPFYKFIRSDEGLTLETSALYSLWWPIYIFN